MKILTAVLLAAAPAAAQAMGAHGSMHGCSGAGIHLAVGLYALLAALGYWVLHNSAKETVNYVKKAGQTLGWALVVTGLLGILCGVGSHAKNMCKKNCRCSGAEMTNPGETDNMPAMHTNCPMKKGMMRNPETAPEKK